MPQIPSSPKITSQTELEATASQRKTIARLCIIKRIDAPLEEPRMTMAEAGYLIRQLSRRREDAVRETIEESFPDDELEVVTHSQIDNESL